MPGWEPANVSCLDQPAAPPRLRPRKKWFPIPMARHPAERLKVARPSVAGEPRKEYRALTEIEGGVDRRTSVFQAAAQPCRRGDAGIVHASPRPAALPGQSSLARRDRLVRQGDLMRCNLLRGSLPRHRLLRRRLLRRSLLSGLMRRSFLRGG